MRFDPERAAIRFGCGLSARHAPPSDVAGMLTRLQGQDHAAEMFPIPGFAPIHASLDEVGQAVRKQRNGKTEAEPRAPKHGRTSGEGQHKQGKESPKTKGQREDPGFELPPLRQKCS